MRFKQLLIAIVAVAILVGVCPAAEKDIHITEGRRNNSWPWRVNDSAGYMWDIYTNGTVNNGTNDAYDGGMNLQVSGANFNVSSNAAQINKNGREIELGPWSQGAMRIWRRIYIDKKEGYCRWIDIFKNPSNSAQTMNIRYYSNLGGSVQMVHSSTGKNSVTGKDWGFMTGNSSGSSRPNIVQIFASKNAKVRPRVQYNTGNDNIYYHVNLKIPAGQTKALCFFHAQRKNWNEGKKLLGNFNVSKELRKVPSPLRRIIVNMGGALLVLGQLELPRHDQYDMAVLKNKDELLGTILNKEFVVETFYGKLTLPAEDVIGLSVPAPADPYVHVGLTDGQVPAGKLLNGPVRIRLTGGNEMSIPVEKLSACSFKISPQHPEQVKITRPVVVLRSGQRLFFRPEDVDFNFHTEYGRLLLNPDNLHAILLDTPESGLHRALFANGSVLSGLLAPENFRMKLDLGPELNIRRQLVMQFILNPTAKRDGDDKLATLKTRNEDVLRGHIEDEVLPVRTRYETIRVKSYEIAKMDFMAEESTPGTVKIKLFDGTTLSGRLENDSIRFNMEPGPKIDVFAGHIRQIICPKPLPAPKTTPTSYPATTPSTQPADRPNEVDGDT